jgi:hypothetical protein
MHARALLALLFLVPAVTLIPSAAAGDCGVDAIVIDLGGVYVAPDGTVWKESNNVAGLQRASCDDSGGRPHLADMSIL